MATKEDKYEKVVRKIQCKESVTATELADYADFLVQMLKRYEENGDTKKAEFCKKEAEPEFAPYSNTLPDGRRAGGSIRDFLHDRTHTYYRPGRGSQRE